jgi:hypothetical protein
MMVDTTCSWSRQQRTVHNYMKEKSLSASDESLVRRVARIKPYRQDDVGIFRRIFAGRYTPAVVRYSASSAFSFRLAARVTWLLRRSRSTGELHFFLQTMSD